MDNKEGKEVVEQAINISGTALMMAFLVLEMKDGIEANLEYPAGKFKLSFKKISDSDN